MKLKFIWSSDSWFSSYLTRELLSSMHNKRYLCDRVYQTSLWHCSFQLVRRVLRGSYLIRITLSR